MASAVDGVLKIFHKIQASKSLIISGEGDDSGGGSQILLPMQSFDIVQSVAEATIAALQKARRLSRLETLLKAYRI